MKRLRVFGHALSRKTRLWIFSAVIAIVSASLISAVNSSSPFADTEEPANDYLSELVRAYNTLSFFGGHMSYFSVAELTSDEMVVPQRGVDWFDGGVFHRLHQHTFNSSDIVFNTTWQTLYNGVVACNRQLYQYSKINDPAADPYVAELRALRAWYYYLLLDTFGNVPLVLDYFPSEPGLPPTNTSAEVADFIESEILAVMPNLSASPVYGRFHQHRR